MSTGHSRVHRGRGAGPARALALIATIAITAGLESSLRAHPETAEAAPDAVQQSAAVHERVAQHSLSIGVESLFFRTRSTDDYTMQGPALVYDFFVGRRWGFMVRTAVFFALSGQMSGPTGHFDDALDQVYDQHRYGVDTTLMAAHRLSIGERLIATVAVGAHVQWFSLAGTQYSPVEDASAGLGGLGRLDYPVNGWLAMSGELAGALDPFDLINHQNPARLVLPLCLSFGVAARY
jgi:hypothetical protein